MSVMQNNSEKAKWYLPGILGGAFHHHEASLNKSF